MNIIFKDLEITYDGVTARINGTIVGACNQSEIEKIAKGILNELTDSDGGEYYSINNNTLNAHQRVAGR